MKFIPKEVTRKLSIALLKSKKNSPHIFFAAGVVGICGGTILACRATLKAGKEIDEFKAEVEGVKEMAASPLNADNYSEGDYVKDMLMVYGKGAVRFGKLYGVPAVIMGTSVVLLTGSHIQLVRRNAMLTATLTTFIKSFDEYRARVREELGEEKELEINRSIRTEKIEGSKKTAKVIDTNALGEYVKVFGPGNIHYENHAEYNRLFLESKLRYINQKLEAKGYIFLNEVYKELGFDETISGQVVGWVYPTKRGDGYIDFGLYEAHAYEFISGKSPELTMEFNVDGEILELLKRERKVEEF